LIFWLTKIDKSAEIFDPSCPDIVGHILEGMGDAGIIDEDVVLKTLEYLFSTREDGMWSARWGINYVYAIGAVYPGLAKVGYDLNEPWILNVTKRLVAVQQADGGFGEDYDSYNVDRYVEGATTASMTAWGLLGLI
jgi:squalene-hopene/tetraprenyl-beta-curcumene cyclase